MPPGGPQLDTPIHAQHNTIHFDCCRINKTASSLPHFLCSFPSKLPSPFQRSTCFSLQEKMINSYDITYHLGRNYTTYLSKFLGWGKGRGVHTNAYQFPTIPWGLPLEIHQLKTRSSLNCCPRSQPLRPHRIYPTLGSHVTGSSPTSLCLHSDWHLRQSVRSTYIHT